MLIAAYVKGYSLKCNLLAPYRFHDPWFGKYFDGDPSTGQMQDYSPLPVLHIYLMRLWTAWLDNYPEDFVNNPVMAVCVVMKLN